MHLDGSEEYDFEHWDASPDGTVRGDVLGDHETLHDVIVWHAPAGTRFRVEKILRRRNWPWFSEITPLAILDDGPKSGALVNVGDLGTMQQLSNDDLIIGMAASLVEDIGPPPK
jgi:hypothetical protein